MAEYIEGKRPVLEALKVGVPVKRLYVAEGLKGDKAVDEVVRRAHKMKISVKQIKRHEMDERSERGSHQGLMLETGSYQYSNVNEIVIAASKRAEANDGKALIVVLDHITDAGNLGAIARSAEVVGASGIIIPNKRSAHVTAATYKSSAGAVSHIKIAQVSNIAQTIEKGKLLGCRRFRKGAAVHLGFALGGPLGTGNGQRRRRPCSPHPGTLRFFGFLAPSRRSWLFECGSGFYCLHV